MFATLAGSLPRPPLAAPASAEALVRAALEAQAAAGLEPLTDGGLRHADPLRATALGLEGIVDRTPEMATPTLVAVGEPRWRGPILVDGWVATAAAADRAVKQIIAGPYSLGWAISSDVQDRDGFTMALAEALNHELRALAEAGCAMVQVDEPAAVRVGGSPAERLRFTEAGRRLLDGVGTHVSLAILGGDAEAAGPETIFAPPYASYLFDLIDGPDNWRLIAQAPGERGIVCGVVPPARLLTIGPETIVWAAHYAASTGGRGLDRVGLATTGSLAGLEWPDALERLELLGRSVAMAGQTSPEELGKALDPRATMRFGVPRSGATGRTREGEPDRDA